MPDLLMDFCVQFARTMIVSGANLERVHLALERLCHAYGLQDVSIYLLSHFVSVSAKDADGAYAARQASIPAAGIHLQRLKQLNRLSYAIVRDRPEPEKLQDLLREASAVKEYSDWMVLLAQMAAMACLCLIFGGGWKEIICTSVVTAAMHYLQLALAKPGVDSIVVNAVTMFAATALTLLLLLTGIGADGPVVLITVSMLVIPGIPLVNAVRNLLGGNEMNGILQVAKITIETLALAMGIYCALWLFGHGSGMLETVATPLSNPVALMVLSFLASVNFGVVFRIPPHDLLRAGLGSLLTRIALIVLTPYIPSRLALIALAALVASLYAEILATVRKDPSTYFTYPSIVPLIPGDLFYYAIAGLYISDPGMVLTNGTNCLLTLLGMSVGFVASSLIAHYVRRGKHIRFMRKRAKLPAAANASASAGGREKRQKEASK